MKKFLKNTLEKIRNEKKLMLSMTLWHEAGLLEGSINEAVFKQQPHQKSLLFRMYFYQALNEDLYGDDKQRAIDLYSKTQNLPTHTYSTDLLVQRIIAQRIKAVSQHN